MAWGLKAKGKSEDEEALINAHAGDSSTQAGRQKERIEAWGTSKEGEGERKQSLASTFRSGWGRWAAVREFVLYCVFVLLFSLCVFHAKPSWVQFELQKLHKANLGTDITSVSNITEIYTWLNESFADSFFHEYDAKGQLLSAAERLRVSGQSQVIGAARLRAVGAEQRECVIPNFLKDVNGNQVSCSASYSKGTRLKEDIHPRDSAVYAKARGANFTLPFRYRTASELDTTMLYYTQGTYATYYQDGYALDVIPNVAPNQLASYVASCIPNLADSLEQCKDALLSDGTLELADFEFNASTSAGSSAKSPNAKFFSVSRPPLAGAEGQRCPTEFDLEGNTCANMEELVVPEPMVPHLDRCQLVPDTSGECRLPYVGFAQLYELQKPGRCGECMCMCDTDPVCSSTCSAKDVFLDQLGMLQSFNWINASTTRAILLDVNLLNPHQNLMTMWRGVFEMPPTGEIDAYVSSRTVKLYRYTSRTDKIYMGLEIALLVLLMYYIVQELVEIRREGREYFKQGWNYVDWANYVLIIAVAGVRVSSVVVINNFEVESALTPLYVDYPPLADFAITELNMLAFNFFLLYFKIFKYIKKLPKMSQIVMTIAGSSLELILFMAMAAIVLFGFCSAFYVSFGADVEAYKGLGESLGSLFQICLGEFDYKALAAANPPMAVLLFYLFIVVVFFILLSMFVAIIDDAYASIKDSEEDKAAAIHLQQMLGTITNVFTKKRDVDSLGKALMAADYAGEGGNLDGMVDIDELREVLKDHPNALQILNCGTVEELMERFDSSGDGQLDRKEVRAILKELAEIQDEATERLNAVEATEMDPEEWNKLSLHERIQMGRKGFRPKSKKELNLKAFDSRVSAVETELNELSHTVAKKLSLMVDLMVGLADTVNNPNRRNITHRLG